MNITNAHCSDNVINVGDVAPDFTYEAFQETESLMNLRGKNIVIYFYPKDSTPGCTIEACDFNSLSQEFTDLNAVIIGVSRDSNESHNKFRTRHNLAFTLISDTDGVICSKYNTLSKKSFFGKSYIGINRSTFLIDKNGIVRYIWRDVSVINHAKQVLQKMQDLDLTK